MIDFKIKVEATEFQDWLFDVHHRFISMVQTMIDVYSIIQEEMNRRRLIPLDFGYLERSFRYDIVEQNDFNIQAHYVFDVIDPESGFQYAEYQHELDPRGRGTYSYYDRAHNWWHPVGLHHRHGTRGGAYFLTKGVKGAESMIWTIVEQDYLSLFYGGL